MAQKASAGTPAYELFLATVVAGQRNAATAGCRRSDARGARYCAARMLVCRRSPKSSPLVESVTRRACHTLPLSYRLQRLPPPLVADVLTPEVHAIVPHACWCRRSHARTKSSPLVESVTRRACHTHTATYPLSLHQPRIRHRHRSTIQSRPLVRCTGRQLAQRRSAGVRGGRCECRKVCRKSD